MIRIAVCDDEKNILAQTTEILQEYKNTPLTVDCYTSGEALMNSGKTYDLILMDIDMQGINGIETAKKIRKSDKEVKLIYITNYSDYSIFAFAVHAFAYLLKPINRKELFLQLDEAISYGLHPPETELEFHTKEGILRISPSHILYFEYLERQVLLKTITDTWHLKCKITEIEQRMQEYNFIMPHKSFVVNLYAVQNIHGYDIILTDGSRIPLSQKKSVNFRKQLNCYLAKEGELRK